MGNLLDKPKDDKDSHELVTSEGIKMACSGMQGYRLEMEVWNIFHLSRIVFHTFTSSLPFSLPSLHTFFHEI